MFAIAKRLVALSIEGNSLRVVSATGRTVETWDTIPFAPQFLKKGHVADPAGLGGLIRAALAERKLSKGRILWAHSALGTTVRILNLPPLNSKLLDGVLRREVRRLTDGHPAQWHIRWQVLPNGNGKQRVYIVLLPRGPFTTSLRAFDAAGLKPSVIELKPMALMRAVNKRNAIIANGEATSVDVAIVRDGVPMVIRSVYLGEDSGTIDHVVGHVGQELVQAVSLYATDYRDNPLAPQLPVYLTGTAAGDQTFQLAASGAIDHPVAKLHPPLRCPSDLPVADYAVNLGLILRAL